MILDFAFGQWNHMCLILLLIFAPFIFYGLKKPKHRTRVFVSIGGIAVLLFVFFIVSAVVVIYFCFKAMSELS